MPGITGSPCRPQQRATMLDARCSREGCLDTLADNEAALHLIIGPQPNYTAGIWPQCLAPHLRAGIGDCGAVDRPGLTAYRVGPQRDHAPMPSSSRTPRTVRMPAQHRVNARRELAERDTAGREITPYRRAARVRGITPDGERAARTRSVIHIVSSVG